MSGLFFWFLLALRLSTKKYEIEKNSDDAHWNMWTNIKMLHAQNNIFKKRIPNMRFWIIYILVQSFMGTDFNLFCQLFCYFILSLISLCFIIKNCFNRYIKELLTIKKSSALNYCLLHYFPSHFSFTTTCNYTGLYFSSVKGKDKKPFLM